MSAKERFMVARKMNLISTGYKVRDNTTGVEHYGYRDNLGNSLIWDDEKKEMINILMKPITRRK